MQRAIKPKEAHSKDSFLLPFPDVAGSWLRRSVWQDQLPGSLALTAPDRGVVDSIGHQVGSGGWGRRAAALLARWELLELGSKPIHLGTFGRMGEEKKGLGRRPLAFPTRVGRRGRLASWPTGFAREQHMTDGREPASERTPSSSGLQTAGERLQDDDRGPPQKRERLPGGGASRRMPARGKQKDEGTHTNECVFGSKR
mmetsp:Transcript_82810/g.182036  ORF Transcript_82810/g.182036 Transcript_82810/m.182036 type:complete len:199 (-) Transcript_82810:135-731(-)